MLRRVWPIFATLVSCSSAKPAPVAPSAAPAASVATKPPAAVVAPPGSAAPVVEVDAGRIVHWAGSRVSLWTPAAMRRPTRLPYLRQEDPLVLIGLAEMSADDAAGLQQMMAGAKHGAELSEEAPAKHGSAQGFIGRAAPDASGLSRQVLGLADGLAAVIIVAQYQAPAAPLVTKILDSVTLDSTVVLDPLAVNGIRIADDAGFAVSNSSSHPVLLLDKGKKPPLRPEDSLLTLLSLPYPKPGTSDEELGQMLGLILARYQPFMPAAKMDSFAIAGRPGFVISAPAKNDGRPIGLYGFVARCPDVAFAGFGHTPVGSMNRVAPRFERLVKSITLDDTIFSGDAADRANPSP
jgi:hypothetical protein